MVVDDFWNNHRPVRRGRLVCWEWTLNRSPSGYGKLFWYGKHMRASRVSWMLSNKRDIPEGMFVLHKCDNPCCIRPSHLSVGTPKENSEDMVRKGRARGGSPPGEGNGRAKLTELEVHAMRAMRLDSGTSYRRLGRMFGLSNQNARLAVIGKTWSHI